MKTTNNQNNVSWMDDEILKLKEIYPSLFPEEIPFLFPNRTVKAISEKAKLLRLTKSQRKIFFPRIYTNDADGYYVTGLTDGEGHFGMSIKHHKNGHTHYNPKFKLNLRLDDHKIMYWLKEYFGCGCLMIDRGNPDKRNGNPIMSLEINGVYAILSAVIPHFEKYPLRAKKFNDFIIWKKMIKIQTDNFKKFSLEKQKSLDEIYRQLRKTRVYKEPNLALSQVPDLVLDS